MRLLLIISILFASLSINGQNVRIPDAPYITIIGSDTFKCITTIDTLPKYDLRQYRLYTYLTEDEKYKVNYPQRIDTLSYIDPTSEPIEEWIEIDTSNHIFIRQLIDTVDRIQLQKILNSEIKVYHNNTELEVFNLDIDLILPNGDKTNIAINGSTIEDNESLESIIFDLPVNSYLILDFIKFRDQEGNTKGIDGRAGWQIKK